MGGFKWTCYEEKRYTCVTGFETFQSTSKDGVDMKIHVAALEEEPRENKAESQIRWKKYEKSYNIWSRSSLSNILCPHDKDGVCTDDKLTSL